MATELIRKTIKTEKFMTAWQDHLLLCKTKQLIFKAGMFTADELQLIFKARVIESFTRLLRPDASVESPARGSDVSK
eukprot:2019065-Amphidinium_carterae.1